MTNVKADTYRSVEVLETAARRRYSATMEKSSGILIRKTLLTDTSLIVHWCTREHGIIRTAAKGARRPGSPFAGKLDLFYSADLSWARSRRGDLHTLREAEVTNYRQGIQKD